MNTLLAKASTWLTVRLDGDLPPITPLAGGPGYSAAQKIAGQFLGVFLIIAAIGVIAAMTVGVVSWRTHNGGGLKGAMYALGVILVCVIIASSVAQIINWGKAIPLFG